MRKSILLALAISFACAAAGCSSAGASVAAAPAYSSEPVPTSARRAARVIESTPVPDKEIVPRPTFSIAPVEIKEVATPVPVFADRIEDSEDNAEIAEPVVPGEEDMFPQGQEQEPTPTVALYAGHVLSIRFYDMAAQQPAEIQYPIGDAATPDMVVTAVSDALGGILAQQNIAIRSSVFEDGNLTVDFDPAIYTIGLASADENQILQSIADSYLINVDGIRAVYFTVDGEPYHSEHTQLEGNEPYKELLGARE